MPRRSATERGTRGYRERRVNSREPIQRFLIVCEGEKTEPRYFGKLREDHRLNAKVTVLGVGLDPSQLIERTLADANRWMRGVLAPIWIDNRQVTGVEL